MSVLLDKIAHNTKRANQIVERIVRFVRPSEACTQVVSLNQIILEVAELIDDKVSKHQVAFKFSPGNPDVKVMGDPIQLSQILLNLFRNAIQAMVPALRRELWVSCFRKDCKAIIYIRDTGPGFAPEGLGQIGTPFFTTKPNGLGMGISISSSIAAQHGGKLILSNAEIGDGGGAIAVLELPGLPETKV